MFDDAANVVERDVRQATVLVAREQRLAFLLQGLMHVHAVAVVADERLRHERQRLAVPVRNVLQRVLENLDLVGFLGQRVRSDVDLALARSCHLVMMDLELKTHLLAGHRHGGTDVLLRVDRRHGEIAAFDAGAMSLVAVFVSLA